MTTPTMFLIAMLTSSAAAAAEPMTRAAEVPELASMALLSVVFAGVSVVVRRTGPRHDDRKSRERGASRS